MIRSSIATRLCTLAAFAASVAGLTALDAGAQGKASMNGQSCSYSDISIKPNGDLNILCDSSGKPACSLSVPNTAAPSQAFTFSTSCSPAATSYTWTVPSGATAPTGASGSASFATPGTYTFSVYGTNSAGNGDPVSKTVTVQAPAPIDGPPVCTFSVNPSTVAVNANVALTFNCTNSPTVYIFAPDVATGVVTGLSSPSTSNSQTVQFTKAGNYLIWYQAGNALGGSSILSAPVTVTSAGGGGGCSVPTTAVGPTLGYEELGNLRFDLKPGQTGYKEFDFPFTGFSAARLTIVGATKIETPASTIAEIAVAPCPGQFDVPAGCKAEVYGSTGANFYIGDIAWSSCPVPGGKHYVNIRHKTCNPNSGFPGCTHYIKINGQ